MKDTNTAVQHYATRVDAVLAQRTRLRGSQPTGGLFDRFPANHPLISSNPRRPLEPNLEIIASYIEPDDIIVDAGGGGGRISLPLALRCREVINVEPSRTMTAGFIANANQAGISNVRVIENDWLTADPPVGTIALVNHVTYLTRDIRPFIEKLEQAGRRRVIITVNNPPPPSFHRVLYQLVHGEPEEVVPGHVELINVLWELGILPDVRVLPQPPPGPTNPAPTRETAVAGAMAGFAGDQWTFWPMSAELEQHFRHVMESHFDELFAEVPGGFVPRWITPGSEVLITWQPSTDG